MIRAAVEAPTAAAEEEEEVVVAEMPSMRRQAQPRSLPSQVAMS